MEVSQISVNQNRLLMRNIRIRPMCLDGYPADGPRMQGFYKRLVFMVAKSMHPLSLVEEAGFVEIVRYLDPNIRIPSRSTLTTKILPDCYLSAKNRLIEEIGEASHVSLTTDLWSSRNMESYMSLTAHYINSGK
jgi:hypothetical protein